MGLTVLELEVGNPASPDVTEKVEFLIDSGAIYSIVPKSILERLGIKVLAEQVFRLADGTKIVRKKGVAVFKYDGQIGGADVIFGEDGDYKLLGAFTLEALGLVLDPLRRELRPLPMILAQKRSFGQDQVAEHPTAQADWEEAMPVYAQVRESRVAYQIGQSAAIGQGDYKTHEGVTIYDVTVSKIRQLPESLTQEVSDFVDLLLLKRDNVRWQLWTQFAEGIVLANAGDSDYLRNLEDYENRLARGEIKW